jgi:hypothetical protein
LLAAVRQQQLEGVIGKRKDSLYEAGKRSGAWVKCRANRSQELVVGGYIPGPHGIDSLIVGYYQGKDLIYAARVRNGFVPASRRQVIERIHHLVSATMPFANLPDTHKSRWGDELTAKKMKKYRKRSSAKPLRTLRTACSLSQCVSRRSASADPLSSAGLSNRLLVGRIAIRVNGMTDPNRTPAISHQTVAPASHAAEEDSRPTAAQVACIIVARR